MLYLASDLDKCAIDTYDLATHFMTLSCKNYSYMKAMYLAVECNAHYIMSICAGTVYVSLAQIYDAKGNSRL